MGDMKVPPEFLLHRGVGLVEFFDLPETELDDLQPLIDRFAAEGRERFSFHAPIARPEEFNHSGVTCFFLSEDEKRRETSFDLLGMTMELAGRWQADYVVTHLTYGPTDCKDPELAYVLAVEACHRIADMSSSVGIPVDLEFAAYTDSFNDPLHLTEIVSDRPELGICVDIGHVSIGATLRGRDFYDDIDALLPETRSAHLWNTLGAEHTAQHHHTPLHPSQNSKNGWIDVEFVIDKILTKDKSIDLVFEYPVDNVTEDIQAGYDWVISMADRYK
mgnify:FL=1